MLEKTNIRFGKINMRFLLIAALVAYAAAEKSYMAVFRQSFRADMTYSVQVRILNATGNVSVAVDLRTSNGKQIIVGSTKSIVPGSQETFNLQIPSLSKLSPYLNDRYWNQYWYSQYFRLTVRGEGGLAFKNLTYISFNKKSFSIYVQTDKAVYKPGQNVQFRVFAAFPNLKMVMKSMDIHIYDANNNKIKQWLGETSESGVVSKNLQLSVEPPMGDWKIKVVMDKLDYVKRFTVAKYVLPKFEVNVELPSYGLVHDRDLIGKVISKYTFGKPVNGLATLRVEQERGYKQTTSIIKQFKLTNGEAPFSIPTFELRALMRSWQRRLSTKDFLARTKFNITASVREDLTNNVLHGKAPLYKFHVYDYKVEFLTTNSKFLKPGLTNIVYFKISHQDGRPIVNMKNKVTVQSTFLVTHPRMRPYSYKRNKLVEMGKVTLGVPVSGYMSYEIPMAPENTSTVDIRVSCDGSSSATHSMEAMKSPSKSFVAVTLVKSNLQADEIALFRIAATEKVDMYSYQVFSRGKAIATGYWKAESSSSHNYKMKVTSQMAPSAQIIVYYVSSGSEIVVDSISFNVAGVFSNKVSMTFDAIRVSPKTEVTLTVIADPNSTVSILAVDKSVRLLKSGNDITSGNIKSELKTFDETRKYNRPWGRRGRRSIVGPWWCWPVYYGSSSASEVFENAGYGVLTDAVLPKPPRLPEVYSFHGQIDNAEMSKVAVPRRGKSGKPKTVRNKDTKTKTTRKEFPETWLWTDQVVQSDGSVKFTAKIPDTITTWVASAFATNPTSGIGVSESTASVTAFLPFFVSIDLPYSVVRGEEVIIQAVVFNYLPEDVQASVMLEGSPNYQSLNVDAKGEVTLDNGDKTNIIQIKSQEGKTVYFPIVATTTGTCLITITAWTGVAQDRVQRQLLVEPEGLRQEYTISELIDLRKVESASSPLEIYYPPATVNGSQLIKMSVIGDLLGSAMDNLDQLLQLPTGCGEQNLAKFVPDIHILEYLNTTHQSTPEITRKALDYLESGYQRQLTFRHRDGSYSTWGMHNSRIGSMWLTSFVAKSFLQARPHIYIDDGAIITAVKWIIRRQTSHGMFREPNNRHGLYVPFSRMDQDQARTAYTYITLLYAKDAQYSELSKILPPALRKSLQFLEKGITLKTVKSPYALAISAYALKLGGSREYSQALQMLNEQAIMEDEMIRWKNEGYIIDNKPWYRRSPARDVETAAYAVLALSHKSSDIEAVVPILKWLTTQRNWYGGFFSTQDTVVALQAFTEFGRMGYVKHLDIDVNFVTKNGAKNFKVNPTNRLVQQIDEITDTTVKEVEINSEGSGTALAQVAVIYNVQQDYEKQSFLLSVTIQKETVNDLKLRICTRRLGSIKGNEGMVMMEVGVPSGFTPDVETMGHKHRVKRIENVNKKLILYLDFVVKSTFCLSLDVVRTGLVARSQPAAVVVYDYYEPGNQVKAFYQSQLLKNLGTCDMCGVDCGCINATE